MLADRSGHVWAASDSLFLRKGQNFEFYDPHNSALFGYIGSLYQDRAGAVWVTTKHSGLWRIEGSRRDLYAPPTWTEASTAAPTHPRLEGCTIHTNALNCQIPFSVLEDHQGHLWVGSTGEGLYCLRDGRFSVLTTSNGLTSDFVGPLLAEPDGTLWAGSDKGLNRLKDGRITRYSTAQGLAENIVGNLLLDDDGWFWTMGHRGLHRMRQRELIELAEGKRRTISTITYGPADGMISTEANVGFLPNACQTSDGRLWFPTTRGVLVVEPRYMPAPDAAPMAVLEQVIADDEVIFGDGPMRLGEFQSENRERIRGTAGAGATSPFQGRARPVANHRLPPGRARVMEFRYTASTFVAPERLRFKFKLEGHDSDWRDGGTRRAAMYTALTPGPYRFRVLTVSPQGIESETRAEFAFSLAPYFHQTPWFYAALAMAVLLSGWGVHRLRVRLLMRRKALEQQLALALERERIAKDMHDDLGASLTQIGLLSEHARRLPTDSPELACDLERIAQTTRQTTVATEEMVWVVSPRHDTLDSLVTHLCQLAAEYLQPSGIRCRLEVPTQVPELRVSSDVRHNLVLFLKEALNNVVKHSAAQEVWLALNVADSTLSLALTDDGRGCRISQPSTPNPQRSSNGNGLLNLRKRAESVGGTFELLSRPGRGTFVKVSLNLAP